MVRFQNPLETLKSAGAEMSVLNTVHQQQQVFLITELAQTQQEFGPGWRYAALALDTLDQDCGGGGGNRIPYGFQILIGHFPKARKHRLQPFFPFPPSRPQNTRPKPAL